MISTILSSLPEKIACACFSRSSTICLRLSSRGYIFLTSIGIVSLRSNSIFMFMIIHLPLQPCDHEGFLLK